MNLEDITPILLRIEHFVLNRGNKKAEGEKKVFFFKVYTKVECYQTFWGVLVFSIRIC